MCPRVTRAVARDGDRSEVAQQRQTKTARTELRQHEQVLEVQARTRAERRVGLEPQGEARGLAVGFGDQRATGRTRTEQVVTEARLVEIELVFQLEKRGDTWVAEDVVIDEVSLTENYREQFNKIIASDGFAGLIKKMKEKLDKMGGAVKAAPAAPASGAPASAAPASSGK